MAVQEYPRCLTRTATAAVFAEPRVCWASDEAEQCRHDPEQCERHRGEDKQQQCVHGGKDVVRGWLGRLADMTLDIVVVDRLRGRIAWPHWKRHHCSSVRSVRLSV